jgi:hypothetical protein
LSLTRNAYLDKNTWAELDQGIGVYGGSAFDGAMKTSAKVLRPTQATRTPPTE